jgi:carboxylesterase
MPGAEPFSAPGGRSGALVIHGFTGNTFSIRGVAIALAEAGLSVEAPLLPGHGTAISDMLDTRWEDWSGAAEAAYRELASRSDQVVVVGLSMGGTLATWLAQHHPEIAGAALVNPLVEPMPPEILDEVRRIIDAGEAVSDGLGSDIADPDARELSYGQTPMAPLLSLLESVGGVTDKLGDLRCPVLLLSSRADHVVPPSNGDLLATVLADRCERVWLERSFHVATLDYDRDEVEKRIVEFALALTGGPGT